MTRESVRERASEAAAWLLQHAPHRPGDLLVLGVSTSEIQGAQIGSQGSVALAEAVLTGIRRHTEAAGLHLAVQCCEHLNRALVVPGAAVQLHALEPVTVLPVEGAGGAAAAVAYGLLEGATVVREGAGRLGMDIGDTFIGMHLRPVVVPLRAPWTRVGDAHLTMAATRPPLIGGRRARYPDE